MKLNLYSNLNANKLSDKEHKQILEAQDNLIGHPEIKKNAT